MSPGPISEKPTFPFAFELTQMRQQHGLNMTAFAHQLGVTEAYISLLEAGKRKPSKKILIKLLQTFLSHTPQEERHLLIRQAGFIPEEILNLSAADQHRQKHRHNFKTTVTVVLGLIRDGHFVQAHSEIQHALQLFARPIELNMLSGYLELTRGNTAAALVAMQTAEHLSAHELAPDAEMSHAEIVANIGSVYFTMGSEQVARRNAYRLAQDSQGAEVALYEANRYFGEAETFLEQSLTEHPNYLYALDELARLYFNLGELHHSHAAKSYWQKSISCYQQVLSHPQRYTMRREHLWEAGCFLAHAYNKLQRWEQAHEQLHLILIYQPEYWLAWYVIACHFCLKAQDEMNNTSLDTAKDALLQAIHFYPPAAHQAELDPDLELLRQEYELNL